MVSTIINLYKILSNTVMNAYRSNKIWKLASIPPSDKPVVRSWPGTGQRISKTIEPGMMLLPYWDNLRDDMRESWYKEDKLKKPTARSKERAALIRSQNNYSIKWNQLGLAQRWKKVDEIVFQKETHREDKGSKSFDDAAIKDCLTSHLTPATKSRITTYLHEPFPKEYIYICRSTMKGPNGRIWYKVGRSTDVAKRMKVHKGCHLELVKMIQVHKSAFVEKIIHADLKDNVNVHHGLDECPFCGKGHREMFSVAAGPKGEELLKDAVCRWVGYDEWAYQRDRYRLMQEDTPREEIQE